MKIVDIDGVVLDLNTSFSEYVFRKYNKYVSKDTMKWNFTDQLSESERHYFTEFLADSKNLYDFKPFEDIVDILNEQEDLIYLTHFPRNFAKERIRNMHNVGLFQTINFTIENKLNWIKKNIHLDVVEYCIEDRPMIVKEYLAAGLKVFYPIRGYNFEQLKNTNAIGYYDSSDLRNLIS